MTMSLFVTIVLASLSQPKPSSWLVAAVVAVVELSILKVASGMRTLLRAVAVIGIFVTISLVMRLVGIFLFYNLLSAEFTLYSTVLLVEAFLAISVFLQTVRPGELVWLADKVGLKRAGRMLALVMTHIGSIVSAYSEVLVVVRLKKTKTVLALRPLLLYTVEYGIQVNEAVYLYGLPDPVPDWGRTGAKHINDLLFFSISLITPFTGFLLLYLI
ncbi:hypothetical protein TCELL_0792 [Thermogladius calderae 1633]|uniref:Uncharacterized protein n=2 Tax=Thermogladius calderae TaxID=1200300 RepID=I3TEM8_THEC1|nr:hypothetical protein TCELL_0792 [Thermogladius calderae 1633]